MSRFVIGIDLGTTNCALAYIDLGSNSMEPCILPIQQWEREGELVVSETLPSFYYIPPKTEWKRGQLHIPDFHPDSEISQKDYVVGRMARHKAIHAPGRVIHAAKSWLCHGGVDRREKILPWHSDEVIGDQRKSPVEVSAAYLRHLRDVWNRKFYELGPSGRFEEQDIVITVPASFDEVAQRLTIEAAILAGYPQNKIKLLEEPQAAFYAWLKANLNKSHFHNLGSHFTVLVCDIGGGTTDFSLLSVRQEESGPINVERIGISDHLLLGGDNIDLSIAQMLEEKLVAKGYQVSSRQWATLVAEARAVKEKALSELASEEISPKSQDLRYFISIAADSSRLIAGAVSIEITQNEIIRKIIDGFFPIVEREERPERNRVGLMNWGLPYAVDTAVTKHLASFLNGRSVDAVLFAGGTIKPSFIRQRILAQLRNWQGYDLRILETFSPELSVAVGAAVFAFNRRSEGHAFTITGGYPRSFYLEVAGHQGSAKLLCIAPKGFALDEHISIQHAGLKAVTNSPVRFRLFSARDRGQDRPGDFVEFNETEFHILPYLDINLQLDHIRNKEIYIPVALQISLQPTGILDIFCVSLETETKGHKWRLEFNLTGDTSEAIFTHEFEQKNNIPSDVFNEVCHKIHHYYGKKRIEDSKVGNPKHLVRDLEDIIGKPRQSWDSDFLRALWPHLEQGMGRRNRSVGHEISWLYLGGYALRPGYGFEKDDWRVRELWRIFEQGLSFPKENQAEEQWWILWRRVAGGLTRDQQEKVYSKIAPQIKKDEVRSPEIYMLAASLERIEMGQKIRLGRDLARQIIGGRKQHLNQKIWAISRVASRVPLYGGQQTVILPSFVEEWAEQLQEIDITNNQYKKLNLFYAQAGRLINNREFDISQDLRRQFLERLNEGSAGEELVKQVKEFVPPSIKDRSLLFGESLPNGLFMNSQF